MRELDRGNKGGRIREELSIIYRNEAKTRKENRTLYKFRLKYEGEKTLKNAENTIKQKVKGEALMEKESEYLHLYL